MRRYLDQISDALVQWSPIFLAPEISLVEDNSGGGGDRRQSSGGFAHLLAPLTSCCVAWFLTGHRPTEGYWYSARARGLGPLVSCETYTEREERMLALRRLRKIYLKDR